MRRIAKWAAALGALTVPLAAAWVSSGPDRRWRYEVIERTATRLAVDSGGVHVVELQREALAGPWWEGALGAYVVMLVLVAVWGSLTIMPRGL